MKLRSTMRQSLLLGLFTGGNLAIQFGIQWFILVKFGVGYETDALFTSLTVPQFIMQIVGTPLLYVLVPLLSEVQGEENRRDVWHFFIVIGGAVFIFAALLFVLAPVLVPLIIIGSTNQTKVLATELTQIQLLALIFTVLNAVLRAGYHSKQRFYWPEFAPLVGSVINIGMLFGLLPIMGITAAAWGNAARLGSTTILLLPILGKFLMPEWKNPRMTEAWKRTVPLLLGTGYYRLDALLDRFLLSMAPTGELSLLYFGQQLYEISTWVAGKTINIPMVPALAVMAQKKDWKSFRHSYRQRLFWIAALVASGYLILLLFGKFLLRLAIGYGAIATQDVLQLWWVMVLLIGFAFGSAVGHIVTPAFYAKGNTVTPTYIQVASFTVGILLKVFGFFRFGLFGVAIGTSIYQTINIIVQLAYLEREIAHVQSGE